MPENSRIETQCPSCDQVIEFRTESVVSETSKAQRSATVGDCPRCGRVELTDRGDDNTMTYVHGGDRHPGQTVAQFKLTRILGRGSYGTVWVATDTRLGRQVALKLAISQGRDPAALIHEAQAAARLQHPNIVSVFEVGEDDGQVYIASEMIDGLNLRDALTAQRLDQDAATELVIKVARGIHFAHQQGIIHRDIKPANIIIDRQGEPFVADFGLAKQVSTEATLSTEGQVLGTAKYMSPEQAAGQSESCDERTDVYALGAVLFELLTGEVPFRGNVRATLHQKLHDDAPSPRSLVPSLPRDLETICLRCLDRDLTRRYRSAAEVADELQRFRDGHPIHARPVSPVERCWRWCRRKPAVATLIATIFCSLVLGLAGVTMFWLTAEKNTRAATEAFYRSRMNLASLQMAEGDIDAVQSSLARFVPEDADDDVRGFEWFYFAAQLKPFLQIVHQDEPISDVAISRDGRLFATCSQREGVRVWSSQDGSLLTTLLATPAEITSIAFAAENDLLVGGCSDGQLRVWKPRAGTDPVRTIKHGPPVDKIEVSHDGLRVLAWGRSGPVRVWSLENSETLAELPSGKTGTRAARFAPAGQRIAIAQNDGLIRLWAVDSGTQLSRSGPFPQVETCQFSHDGNELYVGQYSGQLIVVDVESGEQKTRFPTLVGAIGDIEPLADGRRIGVVGVMGKLVLLDPDNYRLVREASTHAFSYGMLARSSTGHRAVVAGGDGTAKLLDLELLGRPQYLWLDSPVRKLQLNADGTDGLALTSAGHIARIDADSGITKVIHSEAATGLVAFATHPQLTQVARSSTGRDVEIMDVAEPSRRRTISVTGRAIRSLTYSSSGQYLAVVGRSDAVSVYRTADLDAEPVVIEPLAEADDGQARGPVVAFSPGDDSRLAVVTPEGQLSVYESDSGKRLDQTESLVSPATAVCWCDSVTIAVGSERGELVFWDRDQQITRNHSQAHSGRINVMRAFPSDRTIVTAGRDKELKLWDVRTGELVTALRGHGRQVFDIAISSDGRTVVSGDLAGAIRIWKATVP